MDHRLRISFSARAVVAIGQPFAPHGEVLFDPGVALDEISALRPSAEAVVLRVETTGGQLRERAPVVGDWLCRADGSEPRRIPRPAWKYNADAEAWARGASAGGTWLDAWERCRDARWMTQESMPDLVRRHVKTIDFLRACVRRAEREGG